LISPLFKHLIKNYLGNPKFSQTAKASSSMFSVEKSSVIAVVRVTQFDFIIFMVKQVVNIYIIHVSLNVFQIDIRSFVTTLASSHCICVFRSIFVIFIVFFFFVRFVFVCFFKPSMRKNLRNCQS